MNTEFFPTFKIGDVVDVVDVADYLVADRFESYRGEVIGLPQDKKLIYTIRTIHGAVRKVGWRYLHSAASSGEFKQIGAIDGIAETRNRYDIAVTDMLNRLGVADPKYRKAVDHAMNNMMVFAEGLSMEFDLILLENAIRSDLNCEITRGL